MTNPLSWRLNRERREQSVFQDLLHLCHGFEEKLVNASIEEVGMMADMVSLYPFKWHSPRSSPYVLYRFRKA